MFQILTNFRNILDYPLRHFFQWKRKGLCLQNELKTDLFSQLSKFDREQLEQLEEIYLSRYDLNSFSENSTQNIYLQNLYYLDLLENAFLKAQISLSDELDVADIGVSDWFYIRVFQSFLKFWQNNGGRRLQITGFEIDPYRVYSDFYSRHDYAMAFCKGIENVEYVPRGFKKTDNSYDLVTMFFPFILRKEHLNWGLPNKLFEPNKLLKDVWSSLRSNGTLLIVNQGEEEAEVQKELFEKMNIKDFVFFEFESKFYHYPLRRMVYIVRKK